MLGEGSLVYDLASLKFPYTSLLSYDLASGRLVEEVRAFSIVWSSYAQDGRIMS
jgi:hypothetical protein